MGPRSRISLLPALDPQQGPCCSGDERVAAPRGAGARPRRPISMGPGVPISQGFSGANVPRTCSPSPGEALGGACDHPAKLCATSPEPARDPSP
jgi:hypothetical protein